ncbi:MAG: preprotein translocase subunit TatB [Achromobacter sp.]|nr:preprotein translocase subunit TatB [Achromobacter sp.]MCW0208986.1 preprotein translocase subunit TatB [Achromobacter sp.]
MIFKILMLLLVVAGLDYRNNPPRRGPAAAPYAPARPRRPAFVALCVAAAISTVASLLSVVLWMGSVAGGVTGGGYRGEADFLLPVAGSLLALAVACAVGAFLKRRG